MAKLKRENLAVCSNYCSFYKPGVKEESACRGVEIYDRLKIRVVEKRPPSVFPVPSKIDAILAVKVCADCEWRADDCDYRSSDPPAGAKPCGGVMILAALMAAKSITEEDL